MNRGVSILSVIPIRVLPSEKSEMTTQVLFGESFKIIDETKGWKKVILDYDGYEGWIDANMITEIAGKTITTIYAMGGYVTSPKGKQLISYGSSLPFCNPKTKKIEIGDNLYAYYGNIVDISAVKKINIAKTASLFLNTPYLWGGRSIWGIDCSGLVQLTYKLNGINLLRDAAQQVNHGTTVSFINNAKEGDLAFFDNEEGKIVHVGICLPGRQIIHSHGWVRIDSIDHQGIYNTSKKRYSHKLRIIKRIFPD